MLGNIEGSGIVELEAESTWQLAAPHVDVRIDVIDAEELTVRQRPGGSPKRPIRLTRPDYGKFWQWELRS
jgi:hypothetical protein